MPKVTIQQVHDLTDRIRGFDLVAADGASLPPCDPGAHIKVTVTDNTGQTAKRSYSVINPGQTDRYQIAVLREVEGDGGSLFMHQHLQIGSVVDIELPQNDFPLVADATKTILIAGGIGITPILAMANSLKQADKGFTVHYSSRTRHDMALMEEILEQADGRCTLYFDGGEASRGMPLASILGTPETGKHVYVCGPGGLIDAVLATARRNRWAADNVHYERFSTPAAQLDDSSFEVHLAQSGKSFEVPIGKSILDVLIDEGIDPLYDCKKGNCGICTSVVLSRDGDLSHRDAYLSDSQKSQNDQMCICVSRMQGKGCLSLDL
ncbi:PDR/VanB family oxidoreductase [Thalassospira sp.]|uniref:PDR/VanB family oxidoreductase n=1 Tax=Thalassospira sp. TaxID=1912094 RepID=UPI0032EFE318